jgi:hypothetical protein
VRRLSEPNTPIAAINNYGKLSISSLYTKGKHRIRTLSILTIKKGSYLYIREVSKIGKGGGVYN